MVIGSDWVGFGFNLSKNFKLPLSEAVTISVYMALLH